MLKSPSKSSEFLNIVLVNPEIPQNTGNIGRTCVGIGATLHLVGEIGFSLEEKALKRAGLDYWPKLNWKRHSTWKEFEAQIAPQSQLSFFSTRGKQSLWGWEFKSPSYLIFGSESRGLPKPFYETYKDSLVRVPINSDIRSLNLATSVGIAAMEATRQMQVSSPKVSVGDPSKF
jgi:tRNA (cytidine/uridine-2'-O-)-methyltransferase